MGDREFSIYDVVGRLNQLDIQFTGSIKKSPRVKEVVDAYLAGECRPVVPFALKQGTKTFYKLGDVPAHLILKVHRGERARDVRKALAAGTLTLEETRKKVHVFVTTERPPRERGKLVPWGLSLVAAFRRRWRIETGFRDLNRLFPTSHARSNSAKMFVLALQMFTFNAWQIQRARTHRLRRVPKGWREGPTLQRFGKVVTALCAC